MIKAGIIGGAGYTAGELMRILLLHPEVQLTSVLSTSNSGKKIIEVHKDLIGETDLSFSDQLETDLDVVFLCSGHGKSLETLEKQGLSKGTKIIDLSRDFRLKADAQFGERSFIYGLPELNKAKIQQADSIANPGCFATTIQLALLPLASANQLNDEVHVHAITGSTGAGQSPSPTTHFSWRNNNVSIYKAFTHQHLDEITESMMSLQPSFSKAINFIPVRGNFTRGIFATAYINTSLSLAEAKEIYADFYKNAPFTLISETPISLKEVVNTNRCLLHLQKEGDKLLITSVTDNLLKGASGQAVQNMNLIFGFEETLGLKMKSVMF